MENRFIYFGMAVETADQQVTSQAETGVNFKDVVDTDEGLKKLQAEEKNDTSLEHGGRNAVAQADLLEKNKSVTEKGKEVLGKRKSDLNTALDAHKNNPTKETAQKVNDAINALKKSVKFQNDKLQKQEKMSSSYENLLSLPNAKEQLKNLEVQIDSETHSNKLKGALSLEDFRDLGLKNQEKYYDFVKEQLLNPEAENGDKNLESLKNSLLTSKDVPQSWKDWLNDPQSFKGVPPENQTLEYAVKWINKNIGELKHQVAKYEKFTQQHSHEFNKAGAVLWNVDAFQQKSRHERNEYLEKMGKEAERLQLEGAAAELKSTQVSQEAETNIRESNTEAIDAEKKETEMMAEDLAPKLQEFAKTIKFEDQVNKRQQEIEASGVMEDAAQKEMSDLRKQAQEGEGVSAGKFVMGKVKDFFTFKKSEASEQEVAAQPEEADQLRQQQEEAQAAFEQAQAAELQQEATAQSQQPDLQQAEAAPVMRQVPVEGQNIPTEQNIQAQQGAPVEQDVADQNVQAEQAAAQQEQTKAMNRQAQMDQLRQQLAGSAQEHVPQQPARTSEAQPTKPVTQPKEMPTSKLHMGDVQKVLPKKTEVKKETPEEQARREIAQKTLANQDSQREFSKALGLNQQIKEKSDMQHFQKLLALKRFDASTISTNMTPEMKKALKRNAAKVAA